MRGVGPLAAAFGVGAAVVFGPCGAAVAESGGSESAAAHRAERSAGPTATTRAPNRLRVAVTGPARAVAPPRGTVHSVRPEPHVARVAVRSSSLEFVRPARPEVRAAPTAAAAAGAPGAVSGVTASAVGNPFAGLFSSLAALLDNQTPRLNPTQTSQGPTGIISGQLNATDPDSPRLTFTVTEAPGHGSAAVGADGSWTYTPGPAIASAGGLDSFRVTVSDAASGFAIHGLAGLLHMLTFGLVGSRGDSSTATVAVAVTPVAAGNNPPTGSVAITAIDAATGRVSGSVTGSDADGDRLSYSAPATTAKGEVSIDAASGAFSYTPGAAARHAAARIGAPAADTTDAFTVTVSDGLSGTAVAVTVDVSPANTAPVAGAPTVGDPDPVSGVVNGSITAGDADGDPLGFTAPVLSAKGTVTIGPTGSFSYTPSATARQNAALPGAAPADLQDSFTVTISDGYGGTDTATVTVSISPAAAPAGPLAAFPGAEGFGAFATGGRGGSVIYVTNLAASGPGSLQWAIDQPGPKYILFKVSGLIDAQIHLTNGDVTIAGQTSPGGITVRGFVTDETPYQDQAVRAPADFAENWILQHIRIRPGAGGPSDDGLRLRYTRNAIVDHVSIGNATDEALEISYSNNVTVQNTIIAETVGGHSFYGGVLMNYSNPAYGFALDNVSLHHNVFNRIEGRLPEGSRESAAAAGSFSSLELSNNLYWDPRFFIALGIDTAVAGGQPIYWKLNAVNNYFRTTNTFPYGMFDDQILNVGRNELFVSGNEMSLYPGRSDYELFYCCNDYRSETNPDPTARRAQDRTTRHPFPVITYTPTGQLRAVLSATAGAWPRDPMDLRLMQSVADDTIAAAPPNTNPAADALLPAYTGAAPAAPADTDNDGMPDSWEIAKGLDPAVANTNARSLSTAGYTDLEVYLHELAASRMGAAVL